jgi:LTXXQ motif family protein
MPTVSTRIGAVAIIAAALCAPQAALAFGIRLGPFHLHLPGPHYYHRYHGRMARSEPAPRMARAEPGEAATPAAQEQSETGSPSLLYPVLAWPALDDDIFWPRASAPWAFGYDSIFNQAFAKYSPQRVAAFCPTRISVDELVMRITRETVPTAAQRPLLQNLATALGQANGYLIKSCPGEIPPRPVARLQLMENQIDAMIMALDIVRPRLQAFEQSLGDKQRARLNGPAPSGATSAVPACKLNANSVSASLARLERAVEPTDAQRPALAVVGDAFNRAAAALDADCSAATAPTALGRLEALETRLDATWRAVLTIQVALANFQGELNDEQIGRFNALEIAAAH